MGQQSHETIDAFLDSLKRAGVKISNEQELRERLVEARLWHMAFMTLAAHGQPLGIRFESDDGQSIDEDALQNLFARHSFPSSAEGNFAARLKTAH
ncbi:hypothetical protein [Viridibacterium curvum]|uniref:Uncharacterized protein n=1 Tax=Viridibacterium curvum TaxID=1101404 RepID=A0ABP9Q9P4_9RHOO